MDTQQLNAQYRNYRYIKRRKTTQINVGNVAIGGGLKSNTPAAPIAVQSMTNTSTTDIQGTIKQVNQCAEIGADLMRISVPDKDCTEALKKIIPYCQVPIIADIHFHYRRAIEAAVSGAACLRINPGNIGSIEKVKEVIKAAKDYNCSIRIGVNAGSLEKEILQKYKSPCPEALVESAMEHIKILEDNDFYNFKISVKASDALLAIKSYKKLAKKINYPLHIGITESGSRFSGSIRSAIGLGSLLMSGIGDTIRVSLSDDPIYEVKAAYEILKSLNLRSRGVNIISCPSCARQAFDVVTVVKKIEEKLENIKESITVSILGCVVNGLGEAAHSEIGITGGGQNRHVVYINGNFDHKVTSDELVEHVVKLVKEKINNKK